MSIYQSVIIEPRNNYIGPIKLKRCTQLTYVLKSNIGLLMCRMFLQFQNDSVYYYEVLKVISCTQMYQEDGRYQKPDRSLHKAYEVLNNTLRSILYKLYPLTSKSYCYKFFL